jgi:hypothetical protein
MCDSEALLRWHLIAFLLDLYLVHNTLHNASDFTLLAVTGANGLLAWWCRNTVRSLDCHQRKTCIKKAIVAVAPGCPGRARYASIHLYCRGRLQGARELDSE